MKPKIKYTISINRSKNGQFFWSVKAGNSKKTATTGEFYKRKAHAVKMAVDLFLAGHGMETVDYDSYPFGCWWNGADDCRLLEDLTTTTTTKKKTK